MNKVKFLVSYFQTNAIRWLYIPNQLHTDRRVIVSSCFILSRYKNVSLNMGLFRTCFSFVNVILH